MSKLVLPDSERIVCESWAIRVADRIMSLAKRDLNGVFWSSFRRTNDSERNAQLDISLSTGTTGILLFLSDVYLLTGDRDLRNAIEEGLGWLSVRTKSAPRSHGYYLGFPGFVFARALVESRLGIREPWQDAREEISIASSSLSNGGICSVNGGLAGTLLAMLASSAGDGAPVPREFAASVVSELNRRTRLTDCGAYWDRYTNSSGPCLGFLDGNAGIEYVLAHLTTQDVNDGLRYSIEASHSLANSLFNTDTRNWPDHINYDYINSEWFRKRARVAVENGNADVFKNPGDSPSWAHGAAGILVARLAAECLVGSTKAGADFERAADRILVARGPIQSNPSLAIDRGLSGVGLVVAQLDISHRRSEFLALFQEIAQIAVSRCEKTSSSVLESLCSDNLGLLNGLSGIGHFLLVASRKDRPADPIVTPLARCSSPDRCISSALECVNEVTEGLLPLTARGSGTAIRIRSVPKQLTLKNVLKASSDSIPTFNKLAREVLRYEVTKHYFEQNQTAYNFVYYSKVFRQEKYVTTYSKMAQEKLLRHCVVLALGVSITKRNFSLTKDRRNVLGAPGALLIETTYQGITERPLTRAAFLIYSQLHPNRSLKEVCELLEGDVALNGFEKGRLTVAVCQQIRTGLEEGVLSLRSRNVIKRLWNRLNGNK